MERGREGKREGGRRGEGKKSGREGGRRDLMEIRQIESCACNYSTAIKKDFRTLQHTHKYNLIV